MNLYLHGIGDGGSPVEQGDALASDGGERFKVVLTNPPFGKKSSYKVVGEDGSVTTEREHYEREDFKFTTANKEQFAARFGVSVAMLRHWGRGDRVPHGPALVLLNLIDREPQAVMWALG